MTTSRVTVSLPSEILQSAQHIADERGLSFSAVVSDALAGWLRSKLIDAWLAEHQVNHGPFNEDELRELAADAGVPYLAPRRETPAA
jgi:post-segregation antitoxin (ccd killing protein)